jgi:hypothetical protein
VRVHSQSRTNAPVLLGLRVGARERNIDGGGDRLSALSDATLTRVLSHLTTDEAVRNCFLSRRWRRLHLAVPVVDLVDGNTDDQGDLCHCVDDLLTCFDHKVTCALLFRDLAKPIRRFRLDAFNPTTELLNQWVAIAATFDSEEVDVEVRYPACRSRRRICPFGPYEDASADIPCWFAATPHQLFRSRTLRRLRLANWTLAFPRDVSVLPSLETLFLKRVKSSDDALRRLLSSYGTRFVDLTLEECPAATEVAVTSARLRSFTMSCCHHASRVVLDTLCLRSLHYRGGLPGDLAFLVTNHTAITTVTIDICEGVDSKTSADVAPVRELISRCTNLTFLHLALRPEMACHGSSFASALRGLPRLRQLELKGVLQGQHSITSVSVLLQSTRNLEVLSLFPLLPDPPKMRYFSDKHRRNDGEDDDYISQVYVPNCGRLTSGASGTG